MRNKPPRSFALTSESLDLSLKLQCNMQEFGSDIRSPFGNAAQFDHRHPQEDLGVLYPLQQVDDRWICPRGVDGPLLQQVSVRLSRVHALGGGTPMVSTERHPRW